MRGMRKNKAATLHIQPSVLYLCTMYTVNTYTYTEAKKNHTEENTRWKIINELFAPVCQSCTLNPFTDCCTSFISLTWTFTLHSHSIKPQTLFFSFTFLAPLFSCHWEKKKEYNWLESFQNKQCVPFLEWKKWY